jgi:ATP-dependent DNA helicase RecG
MLINEEQLRLWMDRPTENEVLEFKQAKNNFSKEELLRYCVAIANEKGGHLIFGVSDRRPRQIVGTQAFLNVSDITAYILNKLHFRVEIQELTVEKKRVLIFDIPPRPAAIPLHLDGTYLMRSGEQLTSMSPDKLKRIFAEDVHEWENEVAKGELLPEQIIELLDTQSYFELIGLPYPSDRHGVLARLESEGLIQNKINGWCITQLGAILLAKKLDAFPQYIARKAPRVILYDGQGKSKTKNEKTGTKGYAVGFSALVDFVHSIAPQNRFIEESVREEAKMFPKQALRELIANALIHQDFSVSGAGVMIEMFDDRVEISNPGIPPIQVERFIDEYQSRNERLADLMRRMGICEEKGSGIDKVVEAAELYQLPAPDFRVGTVRTTTILFAHKEFQNMDKSDRIRACYQHCCLEYLNNKRMSNNSLRERFRVSDSKVATVSVVIGQTKEAGLIKVDDAETTSTRYARYLPFWA